jgi:hypothetical protein
MFQQDHYINHLIQNSTRQKEANQSQFFRGKIAGLSVLQDHGNAMLTNTAYTVEVIDTSNPDGSPLLIGGCIILASNAGPFGFGNRDPLVKGTPVVCLSLRGDYRDVFILGTFKAYGDYSKFFQQGISTKPGEAQEGKYVNTSTYSIYPPMVGLPNSKTELLPKYKSEYQTKFDYEDLAKATPELGGLNLQNNFNGDTLHYTVGKQLFYADEDILLLSGVAGKSRCDSFKELSVFYSNYANTLETTFIKASGVVETGVKSETEISADPLFNKEEKPTNNIDNPQAKDSNYAVTNNKSAAETSAIVGANSNSFLKRFDKNDPDFREWATLDFHISELKLLAKKYAEEAVSCEQNQNAQVLADAVSGNPLSAECSTTKDTPKATSNNAVITKLINEYNLTNLALYKFDPGKQAVWEYLQGYKPNELIDGGTASTIKLVIALGVLSRFGIALANIAKAEASGLDLNKVIQLDSAIAVAKSPGYSVTIRQALTNMLKESSNDDSNMLVKYVLGGEEEFNKLIKSLGFTKTSFGYFKADVPAGAKSTKVSTAAELSRAMKEIVVFNTTNISSKAIKDLILSALRNNNYIAGYDYRVANKVGFISSKIADVAWLQKDNINYVVCMYLGLTGGGWDARKNKLKEAMNLLTKDLTSTPSSAAQVCSKTPAQLNMGVQGEIRDRGTVSIVQLPAKEDRRQTNRNSAIGKIVLHNTVTSLAETVAAYKGLEGYADKKVSAHYTVARTGVVYQHVKDSEVAFHLNGGTGNSTNANTLGIEIEATLANPYMTAVQEQALIKLIKEKLKTTSLNKTFIHPHRDLVTNTECPNLIWLFSNTPEKLKKNHPHGDFNSWINKNFS